MSKQLSAVLAVLVLLALAFSLCAPAFAEGAVSAGPLREEDGVIHIRTVEDLLLLAMDCSLDTWSDGKKIVLENDLSLSAAGFASIPIFNGEFDGGGHTIYDLELVSAQSPCGFFLETGADADIHDLNLSGTVVTQGNDSMVGGVAGLNRGLLTNCSFTGEVSAVSVVGGIVGKNDVTGVITTCAASGSVHGLAQVGGIAGENAGAVLHCENRAFVNTESVDPTLRPESIDTSSILNFVHSLRSDSAGITSDIGGIAGCNTGFVEYCSNSGAVGYLHLGYNVGGIAGRSSGYINACANNGEIYGRKDVGGVLGQGEPLSEVVEAQSMLAGLSYRLRALNQSLNDALTDARSASQDLAARFQNLTYHLNPIAEAVNAIDVTDPETVFYLQGVITDNLYEITNEVAAIGDGLDQQANILFNDMEWITQDLGALTGTAAQTVDSLTQTEGDREVLVDSSADNDGEEVAFGKTISCDNNGSVYGDNNVGGIAGCLSVESDLDPEAELLSGSAGSIAKSKLNVHAVITGCVNRGAVTARHECAGGIAGKMDLGIASNCAAYGSVSIEDGDYAGGVCGLLYGSVKSCCVKCVLSAKRYVGGVVGNGSNSRGDEDKSSRVSGCYTLVSIPDRPQFAGAISGGAAGVYENNFFVSDDYAGLDRLSIHGKAEPIRFEDFAAVENMPEECRTFTLRFVVDGAVIREIPFSYGQSFDRSVFPQVDRRGGAYAVWDRSDLSNLRFDTTVTASFRMDETVLRSEEQRGDGRAAVYVDGQFQQGDALTLRQIPVEEGDIRAFTGTWQDTVRAQLRSIFREHEPDYSIPVSVAERLVVSFPDDGLAAHSLRYLPPDGQTRNYRLYLAGENGWQRVHPGTFGSYYLLSIPGTEAELVLVSTIQSWWIVAYIAAALLALALLIVLIVKLRRLLRARPKKERPPFKQRAIPRWVRAHRKPLLIALPLALVLAAAVALPLRFGSIGSALSAYRMLKDFSGRDTDVKTEIRIQTDERDVSMTTNIHRVLVDGHMIRCTEQYGIPLYISDGMVCMENGRVFRLAEGQLSQGKVLDLAVDVFLHEEIEKAVEDGAVYYSAVIGGETADRIFQLFLSAGGEELLRAESMTVSLRGEGGSLLNVSFSGSGSTAAGKTFRFDVTLTPEPISEKPEIPQAVRDAIASGGGEDTQVLSEDLLLLLSAWIKNESAETVSAEISVNADCGSLKLNPRYRYWRSTVEDTDIRCIQSALFRLYFTDTAACTADGRDLSEAQQRVVDAAQLIPIARELCLKGDFSSAGTGERSIYTIALSGDDAADIVSRVLPELKRLNVSYSECRLRITVADGALEAIELDCGGSLRVVSRDVDAKVVVEVRFGDEEADEIPAAVRAALVG